MREGRREKGEGKDKCFAVRRVHARRTRAHKNRQLE